MSYVALGASAISFGASIVQGIGAKRKEKEAKRQADLAMENARKKAEVNYLEGLRVPTEVYDEAYRQTMGQSKQMTQALAEADPRTLAAGVGKVHAGSVNANLDIANQKAQALYNRDMLVAEEEGNRRDDLVDIYKGEAEGAQTAAAQYDEQAGQAFTNAIKSGGQFALGMAQEADLFGDAKLADDLGVMAYDQLGKSDKYQTADEYAQLLKTKYSNKELRDFRRDKEFDFTSIFN